MGKRYQVAKVLIRVLLSSDTHFLMSRKRAPGSPNDDRLEFLGGRLDAGETVSSALLRELKEEETTGTLANLAAGSDLASCEKITGDAHQHLFGMTIDANCVDQLIASEESHGFVVVPATELQPGDRFTRKTNMILHSLAEDDPLGLLRFEVAE